MLKVLAGPTYLAAASIIPIVVLAYLFRAIGDFFRCVLYVHGRPGLDALYNWVGAIVELAGYFLLIPRFGKMGGAVATLIIFLVVSGIATWSAHRMLPYRLEGSRLGKLSLAALCIGALHFAVTANSFATELGLGLGLLLAFPALLVLMGFVTDQEWIATRNGMASLRRRFA